MGFFKFSFCFFLVALQQAHIIKGIYLYFFGLMSNHGNIELIILILKLDVGLHCAEGFGE